jgi:hypothetical protein
VFGLSPREVRATSLRDIGALAQIIQEEQQERERQRSLQQRKQARRR